jgi:hypothetical protein
MHRGQTNVVLPCIQQQRAWLSELTNTARGQRRTKCLLCDEVITSKDPLNRRLFDAATTLSRYEKGSTLVGKSLRNTLLQDTKSSAKAARHSAETVSPCNAPWWHGKRSHAGRQGRATWLRVLASTYEVHSNATFRVGQITIRNEPCNVPSGHDEWLHGRLTARGVQARTSLLTSGKNDPGPERWDDACMGVRVQSMSVMGDKDSQAGHGLYIQ